MKKIIILIVVIAIIVVGGSILWEKKTASDSEVIIKNDFPKIASWLSKKDEIIQSGKPFDLLMSAWFTPKEAKKIKANNHDAIILAGLTLNWTLDNPGWMKFLETVAGKKVEEEMYLKKANGQRCGFGWASAEWQHEEIYSMDPRNEKWIDLITTFYKNVLDQPQHDGIIVDMVVEKQFWCPDAISDQEWLSASKALMENIKQLNTENKLVIFNAGKDFSDIDQFEEYFDGYLMENFMGSQLKTTFDDGLNAAKRDHIVIYNADTNDTGTMDMRLMRLGLTLSLLSDNTYFTYDFGPRDHGQAWWFDEYDADLGKPLGDYYKKDNAYFRDFEKGVVVSSPYVSVDVSFETEYQDVTTKSKSTFFTVEKGDGRIFVSLGL